MKSKLINDPNRDRGWARLELSFDEADQTRPAEGEKFTFSVQKIPEQTFLQAPGGDRWPAGGAERYLSPDGQSWDGRSLVLELGPDFTSALAKVPCRFSLRGSSGTEFNQLRLDTAALNLPPADYKIVIDAKKLAEEERRRREAEEQKRREEEEAFRREEERQAAELARQRAELEAAEAAAAEPVQSPPSKKWLIGAAALALLALAGGLGWYFFGRTAAPVTVVDTEPEPAQKDERPEAPVLPPAAAEGPVPAEGGQASAGSPDPKGEVQSLFRRNAAYDELEAAFGKYDGQAGAEDAVFLLLMELAPVKPAYRTRLASFFDPSDPRPAGSIVKNALTAYDEYEAAKKAGDAEAAAAQARLLEWAEEYASVSEEAAQLLNR